MEMCRQGGFHNLILLTHSFYFLQLVFLKLDWIFRLEFICFVSTCGCHVILLQEVYRTKSWRLRTQFNLNLSSSSTLQDPNSPSHQESGRLVLVLWGPLLAPCHLGLRASSQNGSPEMLVAWISNIGKKCQVRSWEEALSDMHGAGFSGPQMPAPQREDSRQKRAPGAKNHPRRRLIQTRDFLQEESIAPPECAALSC